MGRIRGWLAKRRMGGWNPFYSPSRDLHIIGGHLGEVMGAAMVGDNERLRELENDTEYSKAMQRAYLTAIESMPDPPLWTNHPYFLSESDEELDDRG